MSDAMYDSMGGYIGRRKRRVGRKALKPEDRKVQTSITLSVAHLKYAEEAAVKIGCAGNLSAGIRVCISRCMEQEESAIAEIRRAAERRDQEAVRSQGSAFDD